MPSIAVPAGRLRYAAAAVFMQVLLGVIYSWSIFRGPLAQLHGWTKAETIAPYRYSILTFAAGMILASACLMSAALVRWPGVLRVGALASYGLTLLFPIACAVYDRWSRGRVHPVYWWGLALLVLGVGARVALLGSPTWAHATQSLFG